MFQLPLFLNVIQKHFLNSRNVICWLLSPVKLICEILLVNHKENFIKQSLICWTLKHLFKILLFHKTAHTAQFKLQEGELFFKVSYALEA